MPATWQEDVERKRRVTCTHTSGMSNQKAVSFTLFLSHCINTIQLISVLYTYITTSLPRSHFLFFQLPLNQVFPHFPRHLLCFLSEKALIILRFLFRAIFGPENIPHLRSFSSNWDLSSPGSEGLLLEGCFLLQIKIIKGLCEHV